jgi:hypothetical protein
MESVELEPRQSVVYEPFNDGIANMVGQRPHRLELELLLFPLPHAAQDLQAVGTRETRAAMFRDSD